MKRLIPLVVIAALCLTVLAGASPTAAQSGNVWQLDYFNNLRLGRRAGDDRL